MALWGGPLDDPCSGGGVSPCEASEAAHDVQQTRACTEHSPGGCLVGSWERVAGVHILHLLTHVLFLFPLSFPPFPLPLFDFFIK